MKTRLLPALAGLAIALGACNGATAPVDDDYTGLPADQVVYGAEYATTVEGIRRANLQADTALVFNDSSVVHLQGVHLELYTENGTHQATLTSESGELDRSTNKMVARGDVVLTILGSEGSTVWTEELHYDPQQRRIWSDVRTRRRMANGREMSGEGFTSDDQFRNIRVSEPSGNMRIQW